MEKITGFRFGEMCEEKRGSGPKRASMDGQGGGWGRGLSGRGSESKDRARRR